MGSVTITGIEEIKVILHGIANPKLRRAALNDSAKLIKKSWSQRLTNQTEIDGRPFAKRSTRSHLELLKKKMHRGLKKQLSVVFISDTKAVIGFSGKTKGIAVIQQFGAVKNARKPSANPARNLPATTQQARLLLSLGYVIPGAGKRPTLKWIKNNLTQGAAGLVVKKLRGESSKSAWKIIIKPRNAAGITADDIQKIKQILVDKINGVIRSR